MLRWYLFFPLCVILALPLESFAEQPVLAVEFSGNDVTRASVLLEELTFSPGEPYDLDKVESSRQAIMDLGLFKEVTTEIEETDEGVIVTFKMVERWFILPVPRIDRSADGVISAGGIVRFDNLFGLNQQLQLVFKQEREDEGEGNKTDVFKLKYSANRFTGTPYGVRIDFGNELANEDLKEDGEVIGEAKTQNDRFAFAIARQVTVWRPDENWRLETGYFTHRRRTELKSGELGRREDGRSAGIELKLISNQVHIEPNRRTGKEYGIELTWANGMFGSEFDFHRYDIFYREYRPIQQPALVNLNYQLRFGYSNGNAFGDDSYSIGNSSSIRGIDDDEETGNVQVLANIEYLYALPAYQRIRGVLFSDIGNVYPKHTLKLTNLEMTVGVGLRWKIASFVNTDLRVDFAYNPETQEVFTYAGTQHAF